MNPTPDVVRPCMLPKGHVGMQRPTLSNCVCSPKAMMACNTQRHSTVCVVQGRRLHATPDVVRLCFLSKCNDSMSRPTSSDHVCFPRAMMASHARRHLVVYIVQGRLWHALLTSSDHFCCLTAMIAFHILYRSSVCVVQRQ